MLAGLAIAAIGAVLQAAASSTLLKYVEDNVKKILDSLSIIDGDGLVGNMDFQKVFGSVAVLLIVVGLVIAGLAFLGWCGNCCGGYKIIRMLYTILLAIFIFVQVVFVAMFFSGKFNARIQDRMRGNLINEYGGIDDMSLSSICWNYVMLKYDCCGVDNYRDFNDSVKWNRTKTLNFDGTLASVELVTPVACCQTTGTFPQIDVVSDQCAIAPNDTISNWEKGCWTSLTTELHPYQNGAIFIASGIIIIQAVLVLIMILIVASDGSSKVSPA
jgi:uncharacterized membrane protein